MLNVCIFVCNNTNSNISKFVAIILLPSLFSRKRTRVESSPSPRPSPKRATRDLSPADSDGYNSGEDKSERPIGRGQAKLHPQPLLPSPVCPPPSDSREILSERTHPYLNGNASLLYCTAMINNFKFYFSLVLIHLNFLSFGCMHSNKGSGLTFVPDYLCLYLFILKGCFT